MASVIDCKTLLAQKKKEIQEAMILFHQKFQSKPKLAVILANNSEASRIYIKNKISVAEDCGMEMMIFSDFPSNCSEDEIIRKIQELNRKEDVDGIIVQMPLYPHIDKFKVLNAVSPLKDVDGFTYPNQGKLFCGEGLKEVLIPATAKACHFIATESETSLDGKNVLIIGASIIVGRPTAMLFLASGSTVTIANSKTENLKDKCLNAEIIVTATGVPGLIKKDMVTKNILVIDVGITRILDEYGNKKLVGDVDFHNCIKVTNRITTVPNGVGLLTVAFLLENLVIAALARRK